MGDQHDEAVAIRPATAADAEGIARVHTTSWRETYGRFVDDPDSNPWFDLGRRLEMWRGNLAQGAFDAVVAEDATGIVGFAAVQPTSEPDAVRPEELTMLYVLERAPGTAAVKRSSTPCSVRVRHRCGSPRTTRGRTPSTDGTASSPTARRRASARSTRRCGSSAERPAAGRTPDAARVRSGT
ncbi:MULTISPECIES: GNAT family N-acetyltransferase [unclassified Curtobacterium]|uniref:GNAT family N-acetyltransferase n=1 Tax=unclassified Curtobacterium TaxID=257496 RepID=UPI003A802B26